MRHTRIFPSTRSLQWFARESHTPQWEKFLVYFLSVTELYLTQPINFSQNYYPVKGICGSANPPSDPLLHNVIVEILMWNRCRVNPCDKCGKEGWKSCHVWRFGAGLRSTIQYYYQIHKYSLCTRIDQPRPRSEILITILEGALLCIRQRTGFSSEVLLAPLVQKSVNNR